MTQIPGLPIPVHHTPPVSPVSGQPDGRTGRCERPTALPSIVLGALHAEHLDRTKCAPDCDHVIALRNVAATVTAVVLAAGWRPPAQVITTRAGLDALPPRSVVIDGCEDEIQCRTEDGSWVEFGSDIRCSSAGVWLPATVLHTPENGDTRG